MIAIKFLIGLDEQEKTQYLNNISEKKTLIIDINDLSFETYGQNFLELKGSKLRKIKRDFPKRVNSAIKECLAPNVERNISTIYVNLLNIDRKMRAELFQDIKNIAQENKLNISVEAILFISPLSKVQKELEGSLKNANYNFIKRNYINIEIPRAKVDCDYVSVVLKDRVKVVEQIEININKNHDNVHHKESLAQHRDMVLTEGEVVISEVPEAFRSDFRQILRLHDSGKGLARIAVPEKRMSRAKRWYADQFVQDKKYYQYIGHQFIGANLLIAECLPEDGKYENLDSFIMDKAEIINQHMQAHIGFTPEYNEQFNLSGDMVKVLMLLAHCDETGRVVDQEQLDKYNSLIEESVQN